MPPSLGLPLYIPIIPHFCPCSKLKDRDTEKRCGGASSTLLGPLDGQLIVSLLELASQREVLRTPRIYALCSCSPRSDWFCFVVPEFTEVKGLADRWEDGN